jgi:hypothetical protein
VTNVLEVGGGAAFCFFDVAGVFAISEWKLRFNDAFTPLLSAPRAMQSKAFYGSVQKAEDADG